MKITISGTVGSGKSTISRLLSDRINHRHYSIGEFMRDIAVKRGMNINELSVLAETDSTIDEELDARQREIGENEKEFIMDSRLGFHFIPNSFKIFLNVDIEEAAKRIFNDKRTEESYENVVEAEKYLKKRMRSENIRYKEYYDIDFPKREYFDLIIDTTNLKPEQVVDEIMKEMENK